MGRVVDAGREHEDALGSQVAVREALPVRGLQPERDAVDDARHGVGREGPILGEDRRERPALDPLHDDERPSGRGAVVDDLDDAGVAQRRGLLRAALERARLDLAEQLEREAVGESIVPRLVHASVVASEGADEPVAARHHRPRKFCHHPRH